MIRPLKPLGNYKEKYDTYTLDKLYRLLEKQHNRGLGSGCRRYY